MKHPLKNKFWVNYVSWLFVVVFSFGALIFVFEGFCSSQFGFKGVKITGYAGSGLSLCLSILIFAVINDFVYDVVKITKKKHLKVYFYTSMALLGLLNLLIVLLLYDIYKNYDIISLSSFLTIHYIKFFSLIISVLVIMSVIIIRKRLVNE